MKSYDVVIRHFREQYGDIPGILRIDKDNILNDSILLFVDNRTFKTKLPNDFEGFAISYYDVRKVLNGTNIFLEMIVNEKVKLTNKSSKATYQCFLRTKELCEQMLHD